MSNNKQNEYNYCHVCFNARVCPPSDDPYEDVLTDENDLSYIGVGDSGRTIKGRRIMIGSGGGKPLRIQFDEWIESVKEWHTTAEYYPKFCPECGRRLDEYEELER